jgi:hypothetical protein
MSDLKRIRKLEQQVDELESHFEKLMAIVADNQEKLLAMQLIEELLAKIKTKSN